MDCNIEGSNLNPYDAATRSSTKQTRVGVAPSESAPPHTTCWAPSRHLASSSFKPGLALAHCDIHWLQITLHGVVFRKTARRFGGQAELAEKAGVASRPLARSLYESELRVLLLMLAAWVERTPDFPNDFNAKSAWRLVKRSAGSGLTRNSNTLYIDACPSLSCR
jgi:hypothetical protein